MLPTNPQTLIVVMPLYNAEATAEHAIESILGQSLKNLRLIIVDDASTDRSFEIAKRYASNPKVTLLRNANNRGAYYSRNAGLYFVRGMSWGYFTTHDADDISFEHRYLTMVRALKRPRIVAVQDSFERVELKTNKSLGSSLTMAHAAFHRHIFDSIGYFEEVRFGADWEYWQRMNAYNSYNKFKSYAIQETMGKAFIHENNLTTKIPLKSVHRRNYMHETRQRVKKMSAGANWYRHFELDKKNTGAVR